MERSKIDTALFFVTRIIGLFAYGSLSVVLALYLAEVGLGERQMGLPLSLTPTLIGDAAISLLITTWIERFVKTPTSSSRG